tara:strand:- start:3861 stop:5573 length:1713 start_codon:yes stop_codon:yes gene_type:complete
MSFLTQRFANDFPLRSSIRVDQSSNGQKFFSCFADLAESTMIDVIKMTNSFTLTKADIGLENVYSIDLKEEDFFPRDEVNEMIFTFPSIYGYLNNSKIELKKTEDSESFIYDFPSRITKIKESPFVENLVYTNEPNGNKASLYGSKNYWIQEGDFEIYDRLYILVKDSKLYKSMNMPVRQRPFNGLSYVKVYGRDKFLNEIDEYIQVKRDGEYRTLNAFRRIEKVEFDGFDGFIEVRIGECKSRPITEIEKKNKFKLAVNIYKTGICETNISYEDLIFQSGTERVYYFDIYSKFILDESTIKKGQEELEAFNRSKIAGMVMVDKDYQFITPIDYFISEVNCKLYLLDSLSRIHIYDLNLSPFLEKGETRSNGTPLQSRLLTQRVPYGKDVRIKTLLRHNIGTIKKWQVKAISPEGNVYLLQYSYNQNNMNSSLNWLDGSAYNNTYKNDPLVDISRIKSQQSDLNWKDFTYKINCDELGQWDILTTAYYLDGSEYVHKSSFICETLYPSVTLETNLIDPQGLYLNEENLLCVRAGNKLVAYKENFDNYMADILNDKIVFRDLYDKVEVVYE